MFESGIIERTHIIQDHVAKWTVSEVLEELARVMVRSLPIIFEAYWLSGELPGDWRKAYIAPFKKGRNNSPSCYRAG